MQWSDVTQLSICSPNKMNECKVLNDLSTRCERILVHKALDAGNACSASTNGGEIERGSICK